jgi:hypothetical protein
MVHETVRSDKQLKVSEAEAQALSKEDVHVSNYGVTDRMRGSSILRSIQHADNDVLAQLGYKSVFRREFSVRVLANLNMTSLAFEAHRNDRFQLLDYGSDCFRLFYLQLSFIIR